ncbi:GNAT family N-acetyltransferase [Methylobacterium nodulans]|uniref:GCN5-related N-acetyltransferase n=1 Tax=Methylobacterium nodulans (strain LMG 21967 / CNCM I-2342 / ORS 2060) TaxID=460265 RepID=B8IA23_METNO|nr:GNAT family N-acetyltransferase [Methylobacterium nodulans]ACL57251.1 GCN5-related N-acetyltransferase [Methylobacterium nodulans ORS 2060]
MNDLSHYSAVERLRDGQPVEIRALHPEDREGMLAAVDHTSERSLYRRFFGAKRHFTDKEIDFFLNVDFVDHVALVAVANEGEGRVIVGGGRYVVTRPGQAEVAFAVVDQYQGQGIGAALMRHLVGIARAAGLRELTAEVLPDNAAMLKLFERCGLCLVKRREAQVVHVTLHMSAGTSS